MRTGPFPRGPAPRTALAVTATALTGTRLALALPIGLLMADERSGRAALASAVLLVAVATDLLDGRAARAAGTAGPRGQLFDHATDCTFVTAGLAGAAARDAVTWLLPVLVVLSFGQYVADSRWSHHPGGLRPNRLGHVNGVLYFAPLAADLLARREFLVTGQATRILAWVLVVTTVVSMVERGRDLRAARRGAHGSPCPGTQPR